ncbi:PP2C family protein-serine/threonine phosphatase [Actinoplanes sp. Pm04-4]|uniref:PP2C family protein-serine/threonine phosphatase n=1 Tax=Paractinoplanes pyxinae TaxID=2997416 RepID=A0ABT4B7P3_9ACTN|nr:PP2C family protein-serine/threonine phosphatase [Actinoplanes pyxinae]MCY1141615.1 PP2C family protein-serine/threonine phosphatase [Actinoplanes pyxinae]
MHAFAANCAQTLDRIQSHEQQRRTLEALQRNLLTDPPQTPGLTVAVRYHPAAEHEQPSGDWYDAFPATDGGALTLVIGDVTGNDRKAMAAMGQVRNTLRGVAYVLGAPPAAILAGLEGTSTALQVEVLASATPAHIWKPSQPGGDPRRYRLLWCNAGHPPPVLIDARGQARVLERRPDPILGTRLGVRRSDHELLLEPGSTLLLYTDGLIERRHELLDEGLERLRTPPPARPT